MPIKRVQFPDGSIKRVEVPEGATNDQILAFVQSQHKPEPKQEAPWQPKQRSLADIRKEGKGFDPTEGNSFAKNAVLGFGQSFVDTGRGVSQAFGGASAEDVQRAREIDAPLLNTGGGLVGNIAGQATQMAAPAPTAGPWAKYQQAAAPDFSNVQHGNTAPADIGPLAMNGGAAVDYSPGMGRVRGAVGEQDQSAEAANRQRAFRGLPMPLRGAIGAGSSVARMGRGMAQIAGLPVDEARSREIDGAMQGDGAATAGRIGADVAMAAVPLSRLGALSKGGQYASSAMAGAGFAGLQPIVEGESRQTNMAIGGGLGFAGQGVANGLLASGERAAKAITPELRALYQKAKELGIHLTPAQLSNSELLKRAVGMFERMPFSGAASRNKAQNDAGNSALVKMLGGKGGALDAQSFDQALTTIGGKFDDAFAGGMTYGRDFLRDIATLKREATEQMDDTAIRTINSLVERVRKQGAGGQLSGHTLQSLDGVARRAATGGGDRQLIAQDFRTALHDAFGKNAPAGKREMWDEARAQYARAMELLPLVARNADGGVPLSQVQNAINATGKGKRARARGRDGEMGVIASIGQRIKGQTSSGTTENALASQMLNPLAWPVIAASAIVGRTGNALLNNGGLAKLIMREGRGQTRQALAPYASGAGVGLAPVVTPKERADKRRK